MSPTLNWPIFNNKAYSTILPNIVTSIISDYTIAIAVVAIHCVDIATATHML